MMKKIKSIGIIGIGKLGESLIDALHYLGILSFLLIRNNKRSAYINNKYNFVKSGPPIIIQKYYDIPQSFDCIFITVNDSSIQKVVKNLTNTQIDFNNKFIVHCSGIETSEVLLPLKEMGAITIAAHPFQTFFYPTKINFKDIYWGIESIFDDAAISPFINLLKSFKSNYIRLNFASENEKTLYHLSAVLSSNFISLILYQTYNVLKKLGLNNINILKPIVQTSVNNFLKNQGETFPITGPAVRGDIKTLKKHLNVIKDDKNLIDFYKSITQSIVLTAFEQNIISKQNLETILNLIIEEI